MTAPNPTTGEDMLPIAGTNFGFLWTETLDEGFAHLASMGASRAELMVSLPHIDLNEDLDQVAKRVQQAATNNGITFTTLNPVELNLISANSGLAATAHEQLLKTIDLAATLGAPTVVVVPGRHNVLTPMTEQVALDTFHRQIGGLLEHAIANNVKLALENAPFGFLQSPRSLQEQIRAYDSPHLGLTIDAANLHFTGEDIRTEVLAVKDDILVAHISDTRRDKFAHAHIGEGDVDFALFANSLNEAAYTGETVYELVTPGVDWKRWQSDFHSLTDLGWQLV
jgi:sugar phosphate isomerase/epimerase